MRQKICTFVGHFTITNPEEIKVKVKNEIINLIENHGVTIFYNGGKGDFDFLCAACIKELKKYYPFIKSYLVLAYIPGKKGNLNSESLNFFDNTLYPDIEKTPPKFAIIRRNEWMINKSDFLIAYVDHTWGGAYKTLEYAKKKKHIDITNIFCSK